MKLFPNKFKFKLNANEMETMLYMLEQKIQEPIPIYNTGFQPIDVICFNNMNKATLIDLRVKIRRQYESTRKTCYTVNLNFMEANAFLATYKFGSGKTTDTSMLAYKINSETHPKLF